MNWYRLWTEQPSNTQAGFLLATLIHNWHVQLYSVKGGKTAIRDSWTYSLTLNCEARAQLHAQTVLS